MRLIRRTVVAALLVALTPAAAHAYTVTDLTAQAGGQQLVASDVNASGVVTGAIGPDSSARAFRYAGGTFTPLPFLSDRECGGAAINDAGVIVGDCERVYDPPFTKRRAVRWTADNQIEPLGGNSVDYLSNANGISSDGRVVGASNEGQANLQAFYTAPNGTATTHLADGDDARDVNSSGLILGRVGSFTNWTSTGGALTSLPFNIGRHGLNDAGVITGFAGNPVRAIRYESGTATPMPPTGTHTNSYGEAINEEGQIVGRSNTGASDTATIWNPDDFPTDLNLLVPSGTPHLERALAISNAGHILAEGGDSYFLLSPPGLSVADVTIPEPASGSADATFTVTLDTPSTDTVKVDYATSDVTAERLELDYNETHGTLTFFPGETSKTITVPVHADDMQESDETFDVKLSNSHFAAIVRDGRGTIKASSLQVKLEGILVNPLDDTFILRATATNTGTTPIDNVHISRDLAANVGVYPVGAQGGADLLAGPPALLAGRLEPGASATAHWLLIAATTGYVFYDVRLEGIAAGVPQANGSGVEVRIGDPLTADDADLANLLLGVWYQTAGAAQEEVARVQSELGRYLSFFKKPFGKRSKIKPTRAERTLALALGMKEDSLAWLPDDVKQGTDLVRAALRGRELGRMDVMKSEVGGAKSLLAAGGNWLQRTFSQDGLAEMSATGAALIEMGKKGELDGGLVSEAGQFWGNVAGNDQARASLSRDLSQIGAEAVEGTKNAADRAIAGGKQKLADFQDLASRNPEQAVENLTRTVSAAETQVGVEIAKTYLGDKLFKSLGLLRRLNKAANTVDKTTDALSAERRAAEVLDDVTPDYIPDAKMVEATGLTVKGSRRISEIAGEFEDQYKAYGLKIQIKARPLTAGDAAKLADGFIPKIEAIPLKKISPEDVQFLGASPRHINEVGYFKPKPNLKAIDRLPPGKRQEVLDRLKLRQMENSAMNGDNISDRVLQKKITAMKKALKPDGHTFEEKIKDRTIRTTELKLSTKTTGNTTVLKNRGLKMDGRTVGEKGAGFTGDLDIVSLTSSAKPIPPGILGQLQLKLQQAMRADPDIPFGGHGWDGFDLPATKLATILVLRERLGQLPPALARRRAEALAKTLGVKPDDLLGVNRRGRIIIFTRQGVFSP